MKITTLVEKETEVKSINLHIKVRDEFCWKIVNSEWETVLDLDDVYVPGFFPWEHYWDYLILDIDLETGQILNWKKPTADDIKEYIDEMREED